MSELETFIDIFKTGKVEKIVIPIIQRDYAQGRIDTEIDRIRNNFLDYLYIAITETPKTLDFIYGSVEDGILTPLDGQQRLTTLFLLHWYAAKKEHIDRNEWQFLQNFKYKTRDSSNKFCKHMVEEDYSPNFEGRLSKDIEDQSWFILSWKHDPTVKNMINMLDAIQKRFEDVPNIWHKLSNRAITFYLLTDKDMVETDELYIRMNSRGKPLTRFEHFKAQLSKNIKAIDEKLEQRILNKIDGEWTDMLWRYKDKENLIDNRFLNFFKFVCDIIRFESDMSSYENYDEFRLLEIYFSKDKATTPRNIELLERYFDSLTKIEKELENETHPMVAFLSEYVLFGKTADIKETILTGTTKIVLDDSELVEKCLASYTKSSGKVRQFTYPEMVLLYAIMTYLINRDFIPEKDFARRLRIVNNLVKNSEDELAGREKSNRLSAIFRQTKYIIENGTIDDKLSVNFNSTQLDEEKEKIKWLEEHLDKKDMLYKLENHPRLYGQIGIIGCDEIELTDKFYELMNCNYDLINCALMATGFYGQRLRKDSGYYQLGSTYDSSWNNLFHKSSSSLNFDETKRILIRLLKSEEKIDEKTLSQKISSYIEDCEKERRFPLNYYYVKYEKFRPESYGKYYISLADLSLYQIIALRSPTKLSPFSYSPYLHEIDESRVPAIDNGQKLIFDNVYVRMLYDSFQVLRESNDSIIDSVKIDQVKGIDIEDRVVKLRNYLIEHDYIED